ncbi:helix-turn-helix domain-containing protein [Paenibacillus plantarum]|uniref:helix-turn-helix domain-containing protein n=1 Tax=Paenibacillus plantarum TaxID=2654975 RepID=UPI0028AAAF10|nr:helix-turn-helix domain-containing protein [Paenibacillus plantarum]
MKNKEISEWAESLFPLYTADSIHSIYSTSNYPRYTINERLCVMIAIVSGKGNLKVEDHMYALTEGSVIFLPANTPVVLMANSLHPLHVYKLIINTQERERSVHAGVMTRKSELTSSSVIHFFPYEPAIVSHMEELYIHRLPVNEIRHAQNQLVFHHVILQVLKGLEAKYTANEQPSLEHSITYLENHYSEKITRERLAEIAGVSQSHYSILFKQLTGFSPSEYLSRLRVNRAKELLISGSGTLREIALKVGYKDEFYLSRRFKQQTGAAPSGYNRGSLQRVAALLMPYTSHLLLLGLEPAAVISDSNEYLNATGFELRQKMMFIDANSSAEQVKSLLLESDIELIIAASLDLSSYGLDVGQLRAAAPIVEVPWMELGWKEHLRRIAQVIERDDRAEEWLAEFEIVEQESRSMVQQSPAANEIITILVIKPEALLVYGARNVGCVIYQSLGLQPPVRIKQEIEKFGDQFHSIPIELSELADYAGDRILVIEFPDVKGSTLHAETVFNSIYWRTLPAVQRNNVHLLDHSDWIPYNPVSIRLQLQRAVSLFTANQ